MKLFIVASLVVVASAGRLENTYLPPTSASGAGGSGNLLNTPFGSGSPAFGRFSSLSSHASTGSFAPVSGAYKSYSTSPQIAILRYDNDNNGLGDYSYAYETQNQISAHEAGQLKNVGSQNEANSVHGSYSYTGPDGVTITVNYVADENGFQPSGAHLPTPPPIPEAILKSLQYNAASGPEVNDFNSGESSGQYHSGSLSRQYLAPNKASFNQQSGYHY